VSKDLKSVIGARVKAARRAANLTQAVLAERIDRTVETVSNIERGRSLPPLDILDQIARLTQCPLTSLVEIPAEDGRLSERAELEMQLAATGRRLNIEQLRIAVRQIEALK
jgi:transcriptional regulator with XRE-family HTH domain